MASRYPFDRILEVMKPCKIKDDNKTQQIKLERALSSPDYAAEEKLDGCHYLCIGGRFFSTRMEVRNGTQTGVPVEKTQNLPHLVDRIQSLNLGKVVLDGEIWVPGGKSQDVISITGALPDEALRRQQGSFGYLHYIVFDILRMPNGEWLVNEPWIERRKRLEQLGKLLGNSYIAINPVEYENKKEYLEEILADGGEGIVLKHIEGKYQCGKRPMWNWIKVKCETEDDVVIMGFEKATKLYTGKDIETWPYWHEGIPVTKYWHLGWIGSVTIGKYNLAGKLVEVGRCSGFDESLREKMSKTPEKYIGRVIRIKAMEKTRDGAFRHPSFLGFHPDKNAKECTL